MSLRRGAERILVACAVLLSVSAPAGAEERRTHTPTGVPLDQPIAIEVEGQRYSIPAGYLEIWPKPEHLRRVSQFRFLAFAFWMPDRRFPEVEPIYTPSFRPREPGRSNPGADEYLVKVALVRFDVSKRPRLLTPRQQFENHTRSGLDGFELRERFGLLEFRRKGEEDGETTFINYRELEGEQPTLKLQCTSLQSPAPNPSCAGEVYFRDLDMQFGIHFSRNDIERWRENVTAARDLIVRWRQRP